MRFRFRYLLLSVVCLFLWISFSSAVQTGNITKSLIKDLHGPEGKVDYLGFFVPGGPILNFSTPMMKLVEQGTVAQPSLLLELKDTRIRNEIALVLGEIGDTIAVSHLIECLPTKEKLSKEEDFSTLCLLQSLRRLTGVSIGIGRYGMNYYPEIRKNWQDWYESFKDYLYYPSQPRPASWGHSRVLVDFEAKLAAQSTSDYRKAHPWVTFDEVKTWQKDAAYERKLNDFCFSVILNSLNRDAIRSLGRIRDPRALAALHKLCTYAEDIEDCYDLIWTLGEKGDPSSKAVLKQIPRAKKEVSNSNEPYRVSAIERIQLLQKFGMDVKDKPFSAEEQDIFMKCLDSVNGVKELVGNLRDSEKSWRLQSFLRVAGFVEHGSVRTCLKEMTSEKSQDDRTRTMVHGALARLGETDSVTYLKQSLAHKDPKVRLIAAEGLWGLRNTDGLRTLVELLELRPIETGGEGVKAGGGGIGGGGIGGGGIGGGGMGGTIIKVTAIQNSNLEIIRSACLLLGEIGDKSAIDALKRLLPLNLNGVLATGGSGTGWSGRPDVVALAKLGDFSGIAILRESIRKGDRLGAAGSWGGPGDFVEISLKRFIPEVFPLLEHHYESTRVHAAQAILLLLENGR